MTNGGGWILLTKTKKGCGGDKIEAVVGMNGTSDVATRAKSEMNIFDGDLCCHGTQRYWCV